ncbi:molybdenum transport system permease protein ModB [Halalkalibacter wakoensis JCM 9140]|uniref:Molybdenum transport system permease n=1 Tax=Halalkalibacter wakoensis JCM 9140 TaxID=1236970 RepID=W4Q538_9BACI|nr:molybdate ABC transporter permease subunit [Halalkalibacter wakoensis]GAE27060.1 molybdenum transport system permease protein ModB [Halalkalibacter wakoensis JCM 9140]
MGEINLFPLFLSLRVAATATLLAIVIGIPIAYLLNKSNGKLADFFDSILTLPIVLPPTVLGYYLLVLLGRQSAVGQFLENRFDITIVFTPTGAVIAALVVSIPFLIKSARSAFASIDSSYIHAARVLGRSESSIFVSIILPLAWRGIAAGVTLAFARALGDFGATLMVAGSIPNETMTMPIAIYDALLAGNRELANVLVLIMTTVSIVVLFLLNRLEKKGTRESR